MTLNDFENVVSVYNLEKKYIDFTQSWWVTMQKKSHATLMKGLRVDYIYILVWYQILPRPTLVYTICCRTRIHGQGRGRRFIAWRSDMDETIYARVTCYIVRVYARRHNMSHPRILLFVIKFLGKKTRVSTKRKLITRCIKL